MTTLIILISLTNIALGYGLALYLGHSIGFHTTKESANPAAPSEDVSTAADERANASDVEPPHVQSSPEQEVLAGVELLKEEIQAQTEPIVAEETATPIEEAPTPEQPVAAANDESESSNIQAG